MGTRVISLKKQENMTEDFIVKINLIAINKVIKLLFLSLKLLKASRVYVTILEISHTLIVI